MNVRNLIAFSLLISAPSFAQSSSCLGLLKDPALNSVEQSSQSTRPGVAFYAQISAELQRIRETHSQIPLEERLRSEDTKDRISAYQQILHQEDTINLGEFRLVAENFLRDLLSSDLDTQENTSLQAAKNTLTFLLLQSSGGARSKARRALYEEILLHELAQAQSVKELDNFRDALSNSSPLSTPPLLFEITSESRLLDFLTASGGERIAPQIFDFLRGQLKYREGASLYRVLDYIETHLEDSQNARALGLLNTLDRAPVESFPTIRSSLLRTLGRLNENQSFERFVLYYKLLKIAPPVEVESLNALLIAEMDAIEQTLEREASEGTPGYYLKTNQHRLLDVAMETLSKTGQDFNQTLRILRWLEKGDSEIQSFVLKALTQRETYTSDQRTQLARILLEYLISIPELKMKEKTQYVESIASILTNDSNPSTALKFLDQLLQRATQPQLREIDQMSSLDAQIELRSQLISYVKIMKEIEVAVFQKNPEARMAHLNQLERRNQGISDYDRFWIELLLSAEPALEKQAWSRFHEIPLRHEDILALSEALNQYQNLDSLERSSLKIEQALKLLSLNQVDPLINQSRFTHLEILLRRFTDPKLIETAFRNIKVELWAAYYGQSRSTFLEKGLYSEQTESMGFLLSALLSKANPRNLENWGIELKPQAIDALKEILLTLQRSGELSTSIAQEEALQHQTFVDAVNLFLSGAIFYNGHNEMLSRAYADALIALIENAQPEQIMVLATQKSRATDTRFSDLTNQIQGLTSDRGFPGIKALKPLVDLLYQRMMIQIATPE